ncbi:MAG: LamG domain-containing protein, partial [Dehalococcoidia bacterium]|nr:LamG domain-containing protein [Dehalococcoidia bacterium]
MRRTIGAVLLVLTLLLGVGVAPAMADPTPGLVALWHFDGDALDSSGNSNHGTEYGGVGYVAGLFSQALSLDGSGTYVEVHGDSVAITEAITVEAWINPSAFSDYDAIVTNFAWATGNQQGWSFRVMANGRLMWRAVLSGNNTYFITSNATLSTGRWYHVAVTHDGSYTRLYIDGVLDKEESPGGTIVDLGKDVKIGWDDWAPDRVFNGLIDEVRIWNTATPAFSLSAGPDVAFNPIGTTHTITASMEPALAGVPVFFDIVGPDSAQSTTIATNAGGVAELTISNSGTAGEDVVTVSLPDPYVATPVAVQKFWVDGYLSGGGQIVEEVGPKRSAWNAISFGGVAGDAESAGLVGEWEVNFHNVSVDTLDKTKFHSTDIHAMNFFNQSCGITVNFTAFGEWEGIPGYKMIFRAQDAGEPGSGDNVRIELYDPGNVLVYDTSSNGDFANESTCNGTLRTMLDSGNL